MSKNSARKEDVNLPLRMFWARGGEGGEELARKVLNTLETKESQFHPLYPDDLPLKDKIETVAREIYGADGVDYDKAALSSLQKSKSLDLKMCRSAWQKTQYSLSDDQTLLGRPEGFRIHVREVYVSAGAGFVVVLTGAVMTMPGLPKVPRQSY